MGKLRLGTHSGFTIVELLIVVVVIGILATVTVAAYGGVQGRSHDAAVRSDLSNMAKKIKIYAIENGTYPRGDAQVGSLNLKLAKSSYGDHYYNGSSYYNLVYCWPTVADPHTFAIVAKSKSGRTFEYTGGGVLRQASYELSGSLPTCSAAGSPLESGSARDWFYDNDTWRGIAG